MQSFSHWHSRSARELHGRRGSCLENCPLPLPVAVPSPPQRYSSLSRGAVTPASPASAVAAANSCATLLLATSSSMLSAMPAAMVSSGKMLYGSSIWGRRLAEGILCGRSTLRRGADAWRDQSHPVPHLHPDLVDPKEEECQNERRWDRAPSEAGPEAGGR